ncbi:MAG: stage II sporulation protein R [Clostridiales bacterium]|nr:stage II sporulation protein R [Clostridiales bacterium]
MLRKLLYKIKINFIHKKNMLNSKTDKQIRFFLLLTIILSSWILTKTINVYANIDRQSIQKAIAKDIIRFHVIANSDTDEDQELKYQVKDALVKSLSPYLKDAKDKDEAREIIIDNMSFIKEVAEQTIYDKGYTYPVSVSLSPTYFPMKVYGEFAFPPGNYEALQVHIGNAKGKNWWCVMFPPLCFVDESYSIIDEEGEEKLEFLLTEEEFQSLKCKDTPIKVRFKLIDIFKKFFD